jgi:WD40 repeat protein
MQIVSGSNDHSVRVWDASTGAEVKVLKGHTGWVNSVAFSSNRMQIVSGSNDQSVRVWDASTSAEVKVLKGHTRSVNSVAFSSDGMQIVSGSYDQSVRVWDASTSAEVKVLKGHTGLVNSVAFSSDRMQIVSGSPDWSVQVYNLGNSVWNLADENWIISSQGQDHLMWVPPAAQVTEPSNILVISRHGFGSVNFQQSMIGVEWVGCYTPLFKV